MTDLTNRSEDFKAGYYPAKDGKTMAQRLNELSTRLCETSALMTIVCIAAAEMTESPECMLDSFRCNISPALDSINRTLGDLWGDAESLEYDFKKAPQPTADQSKGD